MDIENILGMIFFLFVILVVFAVIIAEAWGSFKQGQEAVLAESRARAMAAHPAGKGR